MKGQHQHHITVSQTLDFLGLPLSNPIGIAAGFDKHGDAIAGLADIGFGFVEIGSVTPAAQEGNPKPRVFRLHEDRAIVNRYGFNSVGHDEAYDRIVASGNNEKESRIVLGINLGKNKATLDAASDFVAGVHKFADIADYLVINVSSPNTPGLRQLQQQDELRTLLTAVLAARDARAALSGGRRVPVALKLAPDLSEADVLDVVRVIGRRECAVDALIVSNTTTVRGDGLQSAAREETGGLSGAPLAQRSTELVERVYRLTKGRVPIVGVGGVFSGRDAYEKILAGASAVQIYTAFAWHGPPIVARIKRELEELLKENGYGNVAEAVGKGVKGK